MYMHGFDDMFHVYGYSVRINPTSSKNHLRNLYEARVTAALLMIITKIDNHKNDGKIAYFPPPNPLLRHAKAVQPTCPQNEKSMKRREKPRAAILCDMMTIMRDEVPEF